MSKRITNKTLRQIVQEEKRIIQRKRMKSTPRRKTKTNAQLAEEAYNTGLYRLILEERNSIIPNQVIRENYTIQEFKFLRKLANDFKSKMSTVSGAVKAASGVSSEIGKAFSNVTDKANKAALESSLSKIDGMMKPLILKMIEETVGYYKKEYSKRLDPEDPEFPSDDQIKQDVLMMISQKLAEQVETQMKGANKLKDEVVSDIQDAEQEVEEQGGPSEQKDPGDSEESDDGSGGGDTDTGSGSGSRLGDKIKSAF